MDRSTDSWMDGRSVGWMDGLMEALLVEWMDGPYNIFKHYLNINSVTGNFLKFKVDKVFHLIGHPKIQSGLVY